MEELIYKLDRMPGVRYTVEHCTTHNKLIVYVAGTELVFIVPYIQPIDMPEGFDAIVLIYEDDVLILSDICVLKEVTDNIMDIIQIARE